MTFCSKSCASRCALESAQLRQRRSAAGGNVSQRSGIHNGIPQDKAKEVVKFIKDSKAKVQASIQGDVVRVSARIAILCDSYRQLKG